MKRLLRALMLVLAAAGMPAGAATAQDLKAAQLSDEDRKAVRRIEGWLNNLTTMKAGFIQVASNGEVARGQLYISRPGRMRFEYDPPSPILLIADGLFLIYIDKELEESTHLFLRRTPIGLLVKKDVSLTDELTITEMQRSAGAIRLTLIDGDDAEKGSITLIFSDSPLMLRQWVVVDQQGVRTQISLSNPQFDIELDKELFIHRE